MTGIKFRVRTDNANTVARKFGRTAAEFDSIIERRVDNAGEFMVEKIYKVLARQISDTGHMRRGISWTRSGRLTINITGQAIDPESGFDYFPTRRFGHETHLITPTHGFQDAGILHWISGPRSDFPGHDVFSTFSRGFHPTSDWTERGAPAAREVVRRTGKLIANDILRELS